MDIKLIFRILIYFTTKHAQESFNFSTTTEIKTKLQYYYSNLNKKKLLLIFGVGLLETGLVKTRRGSPVDGRPSIYKQTF